MNAPWSPEVLLRPAEDGQAPLPLGADGVARWVWESRFGAMLIEVVAGEVYVNGQRVQPHADAAAANVAAVATVAADPCAPLAGTPQPFRTAAPSPNSSNPRQDP